VERPPRLIRIGLDLLERNVREARRAQRRWLRLLRNERAETAAEDLFGLHQMTRSARWMNSFARLTYASLPRERMSYRIIGFPNEGASPSRTLRGITVSYTFSPKCPRTSSATCLARFMRSSYIVSTMPSISSEGLSASRTRSMVFRSCEMPSSAKYSHCIGTSTESAAVSPLMVSRPRDGGESTRM